MRVFRHPGGRQAPIFRQESEGGVRRRIRRQPGGESGWRWCLGMEPSVRAAGTYGARFDGPHRGLGNGGCCEVGEPAGVLFDAAARDDQHGYFGRSLREVGHGICRAAPRAPPPLKTPKCGGWDMPGFVPVTIAYTNSGALEKNGSGGFFVSFGLHFLFKARQTAFADPLARPSARRLAAKSLIAAVRPLAGTLSAGSLAAKAPIAAARA